jgi:uncharacterized protein involved in exopolysaccharide biosynthesis
MVFRHKRAASWTFFGIAGGALLAAIIMPTEYTSTAKFLVGREVMDSVVSPEQTNPVTHDDVTEEDMNSEVGLLQATDVLRQVVVSCGLDSRKLLSEYILGPAPREKKIDKAVERLISNLVIEPEKKSHLIDVSYTNKDPQLAHRVMQALASAYIQKHVEVHSPPGAVQFFDEETGHYKKDLDDSAAKLTDFSKLSNGVAPTVARDLTLQKLAEFKFALDGTEAEIKANDDRIRSLEKQAASTPQSIVTAERNTDDAQVLQGLKNTLMTLQLKRTELLTKFQPDYPLVVEADKEIKDTQASIAAEEAKPIKELTSERSPTYAWIDEELAKDRADGVALRARAASERETVQDYEVQSRDLEQKGIQQLELTRSLKTNEENYLLYLRKREEARMTQALNSTRIVNVAIALPPTMPILPSNSRLLVLLLGIFIALTVTSGTVFACEKFDPSFRTPTEIADELNIPVLAAVPSTSAPA